MTFLDPISGLIAAAVSVPILLLLYFLKLRRKALRVSSTLLWEQAAADLQVNMPFRWLRASFVLLLQLLALLALIGALARPTIPGQIAPADRVIVIIDESASMAAEDGDPTIVDDANKNTAAPTRPTRLDEAKRRAIKLVDELARGGGSGRASRAPAITVIASAATARTVLPSSEVASDVAEAIQSIVPTDLPGGIDAALQLVESLRSTQSLEGESSAASTQRVIAWTDSRPVKTGRVVIETVGPAAAQPRDNVGITSFSVRRDAEKPELIRMFVQLRSAGRPLASAVRVLLDGRVVASRKLSGATEAAATFEVESRDGGLLVARLEADDVLSSDDSAGAWLAPVTLPSIIVVTGEAGADPLLMDLLASVQTRSLRTRTLEQFERDASARAVENRRDAASGDLVIFDRVTPTAASLPAGPSLSLGAGLPAPSMGLRPPPPAASRVVRFDSWNRVHPLMRYVALDPVLITPAPPTVDVNAAVDPKGSSQAPTILASGPYGPLIVSMDDALPSGPRPRRVVVSFDQMRSNWTPDPSFAVFMTNVIDSMTGRGDAVAGAATPAGQPLVVIPAPGSTLVRADGPEVLQNEITPVESTRTSPVLSLGTPRRVGLYRVTGATEPAAFVNLVNEQESLLGYVAGTADDRPTVTTPAENMVAAELFAARERQGRREVWHWFVLAALMLGAVEWVLVARRMRG